ncbi:MAG: Flp family type IVb pilin [Alphaproteobacteria bacterium]|nr:MAG: Flp family type IVb pilin [Alphaproteobacteria bacterium]
MLKLFVAAQRRIQDLKEKTEGATMLEYSLLIGLITVAVITALVAIGGWVGTQWTTLQTKLGL